MNEKDLKYSKILINLQENLGLKVEKDLEEPIFNFINSEGLRDPLRRSPVVDHAFDYGEMNKQLERICQEYIGRFNDTNTLESLRTRIFNYTGVLPRVSVDSNNTLHVDDYHNMHG